MSNEKNQQVMVVMQPKSMGISILLAVLFGPLGMLYSTIVGGIVMFLISIVVAIFTLGFGLLLTWPICIIWAALAARSYNNKLMAQTNFNM